MNASSITALALVASAATASGPLLAVNKQVGQRGTVYDQSKDLVRIPLTMASAPEFTEELTINLKQIATNRGSLEFVWGNQMATVPFTAK